MEIHMPRRHATTVAVAVALAAAVAVLTPPTDAAQPEGAAAKGHSQKTGWGHPDLQGVWGLLLEYAV